MENIERVVKIAASVLAIVVPCILISGLSYHIGYTFAFELNHELMNKQFGEFFVESWFMGLLLLGWFAKKFEDFWLCLILIIVAATVAIGFINWLRSSKLKQVLSDTKLTDLFSKNGNVNNESLNWLLLLGVEKLLLAFLILIAVLVGVGFVLVLPFSEGNKLGHNDLSKYEEYGCENKDKAVSCTYLIDTKNDEEKIIAKGILVSATETKIALYDNKLEVWPLLNTYVIRKQPRHSETD